MYHVPVVNEPERVDDSTARRLAVYLAQPREPPHTDTTGPHLVAALSPRSSEDAQNGAATLTVRHEQIFPLAVQLWDPSVYDDDTSTCPKLATLANLVARQQLSTLQVLAWNILVAFHLTA
ncbi:hypothetical protein E4U36_000090 [Claviceps purpurea]|nr:hypothetical protein E4U36_000090 [Claviceps purpurea]KAG6308816.1 hypothetical protein E4U45_005916 [Claviceps purpurea]